MRKNKPSLNDRKQAIFFKIVELLNKKGGRMGKSSIFRIECENDCTQYIQIDNNTMDLLYITRGRDGVRYNINDLENCDISILKDCHLDVIKAIRSK